MDVYQVETTLERIPAIDMGPMAERKATRQDLLDRLAAMGDTRPVLRFDTVADLNDDVSLTTGRRVPVVQSFTTSKSGEKTPSVSYNEIGAQLRLSGGWRQGPQAKTADVTLSFEMSSVGKTSVTVGENLGLPSFNQLKIRQRAVLESGRPTLILSNDLPEPGDKLGKTVLTIVRIVAERLEAGPAPRPDGEANAGPPALIQAEIVELTGSSNKLDPREVKRLLPAGATLEHGLDVLRKQGSVELLSSPRLLVNWPQEAEIKIGERVPTVESLTTDEQGRPEPKIGYEDVGLNMKVRGRWLDDAKAARAEIALKIRQQTIGKSSVAVASGVTLPTFTDRSWETVAAVETGQSVWLIPDRLSSADGDKASLVIVRLTVHRAS